MVSCLEVSGVFHCPPSFGSALLSVGVFLQRRTTMPSEVLSFGWCRSSKTVTNYMLCSEGRHVYYDQDVCMFPT